MNFTIKNQEFLNNFYVSVKDFSDNLFNHINEAIIKDETNYYKHFFNRDEITLIILLNKCFFQNLNGFFVLIDNNLPLPAFGDLRGAFENLRLFRLIYMDEEFRKKYIENANCDFRTQRDNDFVQNEIVKKLKEMEDTLRSQTEIPLSSVLSNHNFTKGSIYSELHSELSKWSHCLNINLFKGTFVDGKIYLNIKEKYSENLQLFIKKYTEFALLLLLDHSNLFYNLKNKDEWKKIMDLYGEYIKINYN